VKRLGRRLTYANVMATIALFVALGGASYAATQLPKNSVGTKQLKKEAVTGAKVKPGSIPATALKPGAVAEPSNYYSKTESKARFLGSTVVVNKTIAAPLAKETFVTGQVSCPVGYQAIAGGVDPSNSLNGKVSSSSPLINGKEAQTQPDGQSGPATGWYGAVTTQGSGTGTSEVVKIQVVCAPLG
jgi:hypothetical protein